MSRWQDVEIVVFDWNGTLIADAARAWTSVDDVLAGHGLPAVDFEEFLAGFRLPLSEWLASLGVDRASLGRAETEWNRNMGARAAELQPGALHLLTRLKESGKEVAVVSAASDGSLQADLDRFELDGLIGTVISEAADKVVALRSLVGDRSGLYIGDAEYDIEAGRQAGLLTIAFTGGYRPRDALQSARPDAVVDAFREVASLIGLEWAP